MNTLSGGSITKVGLFFLVKHRQDLSIPTMLETFPVGTARNGESGRRPRVDAEPVVPIR
jgi:hypothetical protein